MEGLELLGLRFVFSLWTFVHHYFTSQMEKNIDFVGFQGIEPLSPHVGIVFKNP